MDNDDYFLVEVHALKDTVHSNPSDRLHRKENVGKRMPKVLAIFGTEMVNILGS